MAYLRFCFMWRAGTEVGCSSVVSEPKTHRFLYTRVERHYDIIVDGIHLLEYILCYLGFLPLHYSYVPLFVFYQTLTHRQPGGAYIYRLYPESHDMHSSVFTPLPPLLCHDQPLVRNSQSSRSIFYIVRKSQFLFFAPYPCLVPSESLVIHFFPISPMSNPSSRPLSRSYCG